MKNNVSLKTISQFICENHVISLCCTTGDDIWCANCFYVFDEEKVCFYIMSDPKSRHSEFALQNNRVAGTINSQPSNVLSIKGVQYAGTIRLVDNMEYQHAYDLYTHRFPIAKIKSLPIWDIKIDEMKFTNNSLGFGKKLLWTRTD